MSAQMSDFRILDEEEWDKLVYLVHKLAYRSKLLKHERRQLIMDNFREWVEVPALTAFLDLFKGSIEQE